ncbi:hypothetical protein BH11ARM1_BH11ARM1_17430 [soil metagenome]
MCRLARPAFLWLVKLIFVKQFLLALVGCLVVGCGSKTAGTAGTAVSESVSVPPKPAQSAEEILYDQVRSGHYQLSSALDPLEDASQAAHKMAASQDDAETKKAVTGVEGKIKAAGSKIADYTDVPPDYTEFLKQLDDQDDDRLKAIDGGNAAIDTLKDAQSDVEDMLSSDPPEPEKGQLTDIDDSIKEAIDAVSDAVKTLGGQVKG